MQVMVQKILVGIDFSSTSVDTVRWAVSRFPEADIVLFHSIEKVTIPGYLRRELGAELDVRLEAELDVESNLEAIAEELGIQAELEVRRGWSPDTMTAAAEELHVDLIVVAAHHKRVWPTEELGSTCRSVVRKSALPVLIWRPIRNKKDKTILAALSLRDEGAPVAETAAKYAHYFSTRLLLLHALPGSLQAYLRAVNSPAKVEEAVQRIEAAARKDIEQQVPAELRAGLTINTSVARGRPSATHILNLAETESVDLIVMGKAHAPGLASRVLIGDITSQVISSANCSVLVVPM
jgi:nucleotide-binding universal stress UspA family protein